MSHSLTGQSLLITGANGFIGQAVVNRFVAEGMRIQAVVRAPSATPRGVDGTISEIPLSAKDMPMIDHVIHLAGLAHDAGRDADEAELYEINVRTTLDLYRAALEAGVKRFVWLSSIKVLGDTSDHPLPWDAPYQPEGSYARSKVAAEEQLLASAHPDCPVDIVRPPLVYGPGVKANFYSLLNWGTSGWPLPLGSAQAPRAWVSRDNLADLLVTLLEYREHYASRIWHVCDSEQTSVAQMLSEMRKLSSQPRRLVPVNPMVMLSIGRIFGLGATVQRLFLPLRVDMQDTSSALGWQPPFSQQDELIKTLEWHQVSTS